MTVGLNAPAGDRVRDVRVNGGFHGDRATVGAIVNALPYVVSGAAGLRTVISLPLFGIFPIRDLGDLQQG